MNTSRYIPRGLWNYALCFVALIALTGPNAALAAPQDQQFFTSFEELGLRVVNEHTIGQAPFTATFAGNAGFRGTAALYRSGTNAFWIERGETGTVTFQQPATVVEFYARDTISNGGGKVEALDSGEAAVASFDLTGNWRLYSFSNLGPIKSLRLGNNGNGLSGIDDFGFTAMVGMPPEPPLSPVVSGRVHTFDGMGIGNVILIFTNGGGVAITTNKGDYTIEVPDGWSGTATPFKDGFIFEPPDRSYSNVISSMAGQDYEALEVGLPVKDFFTEEFVSDEDVFDLMNRSIIFSPTPDGTSYAAKVRDISYLPADPAGGINLGLDDDDSKFVKLTGSETVSIYGSSFTGFYVGSNGYITFTEGGREFAESLEKHFDLLRVSGLFRDLDPSAGGQVNWMYTADGVVVTWLEVPEYGTGNSNTFQIELFFDGKIRISWLEIDARGGIAGLSEGKGVPPDFVETDLSELSTKPPPPAPITDHLTEEFLSNGDRFDLEYASVTFTPTSDRTSYTGSLEDITRLPTDPFGGKNLGLRDDNFVQVLLSKQARVRIFDQSFPTFFVGSNGYITFIRGDRDFSQTLAEHFETLRISGLYTDLTTTHEGVITGKQLTNRVAITWQAVPEFSNTSPNTFQIEMFYDGRIRLSWLEIGSRKNIVGLSNGLGVSPDFKETDLSVRYAKP